MVGDESENRRIRSAAIGCLAELGASDFMEDALGKYRHAREGVLLNLLMLDLSDEVESLLKAFVKDGTKEEAVMATKALCGYRVMSPYSIADDRATQKHIMETCERAAGRVFYWMKRSEYDALRRAKKERVPEKDIESLALSIDREPPQIPPSLQPRKHITWAPGNRCFHSVVETEGGMSSHVFAQALGHHGERLPA